jgi:Tfp pilus assembly protein PilF
VGTISSRQIRIEAVWLPIEGAEPALKYLNDGLPKDAQEHLEGMLQRSPTLPAAFYYDLGLVYEVNGRLDDAEAMYKRAAVLEPNELFIKAIRDVRQPR